MMLSFVIAGFVCAVTALCYAELASMVPVSGSAYTYSYAVLGELIAWIVGWALILEYAVAASAVAVGWSNYFVPLIQHSFDIHIPLYLAKGYFAGGLHQPAGGGIATLVTTLLVLGTRESATVNAILVCIKVTALVLFIALALPVVKMENFHPFAPLGALGVGGAAASIFFAYVGFDAVSTAAEETKNPQRNMPIGLIGSLADLHGVLSAGGGAAPSAPSARSRCSMRRARRSSRASRNCSRPARTRRKRRRWCAARSRWRMCCGRSAGTRCRGSSAWRRSWRCPR